MYNISNESMAEILNEKVSKELTKVLKEKYPYTIEVEFQYTDYAFIHIIVKEFDTIVSKDITNLIREARNCYIQDCFDDWYDDNFFQFEDVVINLVDGFLKKMGK